MSLLELLLGDKGYCNMTQGFSIELAAWWGRWLLLRWLSFRCLLTCRLGFLVYRWTLLRFLVVIRERCWYLRRFTLLIGAFAIASTLFDVVITTAFGRLLLFFISFLGFLTGLITVGWGFCFRRRRMFLNLWSIPLNISTKQRRLSACKSSWKRRNIINLG